ncbi:MAG: V-type ATP synthase subunit D [Myxococcaceae bacterium]
MSEARLPATRLGLLRATRRLERLARGTSLLRRKREALVAELFSLARSALDTREQIDAQARAAWPLYLEALATEGAAGLTGLSWPSRELSVRVTARVVWGVPVADLEARGPIVRTLAARGLPPGSVPAAVEAAEAFERLTDLLVRAAPREMLLRRLGEALSQTTRQVNRLERRVAPGLRRQAARVRSALDEREREEHVRLGLLARAAQAQA